HLADDFEWADWQRCAFELVPRRTAALTVEKARAWAASGKLGRIADCLDSCTLSDGTRSELERLEKGDGYAQRVRDRLEEAQAALGRMAAATEAPAVAATLTGARDDIKAHGGRLGPRAATLDADATGLEKKLAARLPGLAEVELINLTMREVTTLDILEKLFPDPIDIEKAGAEVRGSHAILDNMRAVVAGAGAVLASAADWTAQS